jgi:hypothetical protein
MVYLEINKKNYHNLISKLENYMANKGNKIFILIYMEGCGPCNETRPEWSKLKNILSNQRKNIIVVSIDKDLVSKVNHIKEPPQSFPTMRYITNSGENIESYEQSDVSNKDRKIDSFVEWIKLKTGEENITKSENPHHIKRKTHKLKHHYKKTKKQHGGKWSKKYKRSINCNRPKGFSQRQYCKYGRKK